MAIRLSTQSGNTHTAPFAFGTAIANGDQLCITNTAHAVTIDQSCTLGHSPCTMHPTRPAFSSVATGGNLPAGAYRGRLAAVGSTGIAHFTGSSSAVSIAAGSRLRQTVPALPPGATSFNLYLTQAGGAAGTERLYATGLTPGTYDAASASWMDGSTTYASATGLPFGAAFGYLYSVAGHTGGVALSTGVTVVCKGDFFHLGVLTRNASSILEFDATSSPSGLAMYRQWFGTQDAIGTPKLVSRGTSATRSITRSKPGTTPAFLNSAAQFSTTSAMQLDLEQHRFSLMGDLTNPSINCRNATAYNQLLTDVIVDADCSTPDFSLMPGSGGWVMTRVAFRTDYTHAHSVSSRRVAVQFRATSDRTTGTRTCTACSFDNVPPAVQGGGATWDNCFSCDMWANVSSGGGITISSDLTNSFMRKLMPDATNGSDTIPNNFNDDDNYMYIDQVTGGGVDLNPHGMGMSSSSAGAKTHNNWVVEYNADAGQGDAFKSPTGAGTVYITRALIIPNRARGTSGNMMTFPHNPDPAYRLHVTHCTFCGNNNGINTSEGGAQPAGTLAMCKSNLAYSEDGTGTNRWLISKSNADGVTDTMNVAAPANVSHNAGWNLGDTTGAYTGAYSWYRTRFSSAPGANDVDLGDSPGANMATNGPEFVDPTRNFLTWAEANVGAIGTAAQKIAKGLNCLKAIADPTHADYVAGLSNSAPAAWVRAGFTPRSASLDPAVNPGHDSLTIGAVEYTETGTPPTPGRPYARTIRNGKVDRVISFGV